jgi:predicted RNase H-like HicB family nuclease
MADAHKLFPIAVIQDRYGGCYSGGAWLAIAAADHLENGAYRVVRCLEDGPHGDDGDAQVFWADPPSWVAIGKTPGEAMERLKEAQAAAAASAN